jgi:hypothetical protein
MQGVDYVAVDKAGERLLSYSYNPAQLRRISVPARALQACSCMEITTDLRDACIYILHLTVVERIKLSSMSSIKVLHPSNSGCLQLESYALCGKPPLSTSARPSRRPGFLWLMPAVSVVSAVSACKHMGPRSHGQHHMLIPTPYMS